MNRHHILIILVVILIISVGLVIKNLDRQVIMAEESPIQGYRISPPLSLDAIKNVATSSIEWDAVIPVGTRIIIKAAITSNGGSPPEIDDPTWQEFMIEQEEGIRSIPGIELEMDLSGQYLWVMQVLETDNPDVTPELHSLKETIIMSAKTEGYRISPEFELSSGIGETVKDSRVFWQANERFDGNINVEVKLSTDGEWKEAVNGVSIPGLESEKSLAGEKIQTKASFVGGPDFYPSLENIKIFLELE